MTWVRSDDNCPHHPKVMRAGAEAAWLWHASICYSNAHKLNGRIPNDLIGALYVPLASKARRLALKLVEVGLWHDRGDHFEIHDYAEYQEQALKEEVESRRKYERERKREQRRGTSKPPPPGQSQGQAEGQVPDNVPDNDGTKPGTVPGPVPSATHARAPTVPSRPVPSNPDPAVAAEPATRGFELTIGDVSREWHAAATPGVLHGQQGWRGAYSEIAEAINRHPKIRPESRQRVLTKVCLWIWQDPAGPRATGRLVKITPDKAAKYVTEDIAAACSSEWIESRLAAAEAISVPA